MTRRILAIVALLVAPHLALAQSAEDSWDNLKQLRVGEKIEVVDMNLKSLKGTFVSFSGEAIALRTNEGETAVERARVYRISTPGGKRGRNALIGLAIGAGAGLATGAILNAHLRETTGPDILAELAVPLGGAIGAGAGAGIGAAFPGSGTIYRARKREPAPTR